MPVCSYDPSKCSQSQSISIIEEANALGGMKSLYGIVFGPTKVLSEICILLNLILVIPAINAVTLLLKTYLRLLEQFVNNIMYTSKWLHV